MKTLAMSLSFAVLAIPMFSTIVIAENESHEQPLIAKDAAICTEVENRQPSGCDESFPTDVQKLYCFTRILGAHEDTAITHVWFWNDREMARVQLPIGSANWRTWSSKNIMKHWTGDWRVEVLDAMGREIERLHFTLTEPPKDEPIVQDNPPADNQPATVGTPTQG